MDHFASARGERTAAELKERWRTLKDVTLSPSRIGDKARAALVLTGHWRNPHDAGCRAQGLLVESMDFEQLELRN